MAGGLTMKAAAIVASAWLAAVLLLLLAASSSSADQHPISRTGEGCAGAEDITIEQSNATSLPSGVPAYKVFITNRCSSETPQECAIAGIHVRCGFFSSVSEVDPRTFRRLRHDDCLVNDGRPMLGGETVSFEYANSFPYNLPVSAATCVRRQRP